MPIPDAGTSYDCETPPEPDPLPAAAAAAACPPEPKEIREQKQQPVSQAPPAPQAPQQRPARQQPVQQGPAAKLPHGAVQGIDVSNHQGSIDWEAVRKDGVRVAYLKATEHTGFTDAYYAANRSEANDAGVVVGAYHFARPDREGGSVEADARAEAKHFLSVAKPRSGDLVPALDLEATELTPSETTRWTETWLETVAHATGRNPIIYTSPSFWENQVADSGRIAERYPLWVAHWGVSSPDTPGAWDSWKGWQYTSDGSVDGIAGRVDRNKVQARSLVL